MAQRFHVWYRTFVVLCCVSVVVSYPDKRRHRYDESVVGATVNVGADDVKDFESEESEQSRESDLQLKRNPLWLEDFEKLIRNDVDVAHSSDLQADSPAHVPTTNSTNVCHLPYKSTENKHCVKKTNECSTSSQCGSDELWCCHDNCRFVCQQKEAPPLLDWRKSPYSLKDGRSWLLQGRSNNNYISVVSDQCSTVSIGDEASLLRCRHGYVCHIDDAGDLAKHIPDRGHCVHEEHVKDGFDVRPAVKVKVDTTKKEGDCEWTGQLLPDKTRFYYNGHPCSCDSGLIKCYLETKEDKV